MSISAKFIVKMLLSAEKAKAEKLTLQLDGDQLKLTLFTRDGDNAAAKGPAAFKEITNSQPVIPEFYQSVVDDIRARAFHWSHLDDPQFAQNVKRVRRLCVSTEHGSTVMCDVDIPRSLTSAPSNEPLTLDNITWWSDQSIFDILNVSNANREMIQNACREKRGVILAGRNPTSFTVDAAAVVLALRPDAGYYATLASQDIAAKALKDAARALVVVGVPNGDPIEMVKDFAAQLEQHTALLDQFYSELQLSFCQFRVPRVCNECAKPTPVGPDILDKIPTALRPKSGQTYNFGRGCEKCGHSSFRGSVGVDSVVRVNDEVRALFLDRANITRIATAAYRSGTRTLIEDGLEKVYQGLTGFEGVFKVARNFPAHFEQAALGNRAEAPKVAAAARANKAIAKLERIEDAFFVDEAAGESDQEQPQQEAGQNNRNRRFQEGGKTQLLIVEDDADQRNLLQVVFRSEGYDVVSAANGKEALRLLGTTKVDLVVCDVMMAVMNGKEFVKHVRDSEVFRSVPILMLTAANDPEVECELLTTGADDYCRKTVRRKVLIKRVQRLLERQGENPVQHML